MRDTRICIGVILNKLDFPLYKCRTRISYKCGGKGKAETPQKGQDQKVIIDNLCQRNPENSQTTTKCFKIQWAYTQQHAHIQTHTHSWTQTLEHRVATTIERLSLCNIILVYDSQGLALYLRVHVYMYMYVSVCLCVNFLCPFVTSSCSTNCTNTQLSYSIERVSRQWIETANGRSVISHRVNLLKYLIW